MNLANKAGIMFPKNQTHYKYFKSTDNSDNGYSFQTWTAEFHTCQGIHISFPTDPVFQSIQFQKARHTDK